MMKISDIGEIKILFRYFETFESGCDAAIWHVRINKETLVFSGTEAPETEEISVNG